MSEVALATAPLTAPSVVQALLAKLAIPYTEVAEHAGLNPARKVQAVLLEDAVGALMVLFPQNQLLDLNRLAELTGRRLTAVEPDRVKRMLSKHELNLLPGLPPLTSSPCLYEGSLLNEPSLLVHSGGAGLLLDIPTDAFKALLTKASAAQFGELPPLADTAQKIIKLRVDPNATIDDITGVVETDPALAAQVVSWAASPYYASPGKIRSVEDAIVRVLGFDLVINLALGLALGKTLSLPKDNPHQATPYWHQSIYTAAVIEGLTRAMPRAQRPEAGLTYLAGLLHNFGYLLLAHVFPPHFSLICRHLEVNPHLCHSYVEQHLLGISREQIGAWLMRFWDMPDELSTALRFQHDPTYDGQYAEYPNLVCLAVRLLRSRGVGSGPDEAIPDALLARLGLSREKAEEVVGKVLDAEVLLRELASQFSQG
ncbi:histidine kinase [Pseudomonas sp. ABAC21]|nr:histidine kinase [Pseudomonas sp. ABAC21]